MGWLEVPLWDTVSVPVQVQPRLKSRLAPGTRGALPALLRLCQAEVGDVPLLVSAPDAQST
jgi:hypothetical protein